MRGLKKAGRILSVALTVCVIAGSALAQSAPAKRAPESRPPAAAPVDVTALKAIGSKNAPITMEVFSDFQCPACKQLYEQAVTRIIENYVNTGKVYLIHRDMPLQAHPYSREAARYANAAARLRKMEPVVAALFAQQEKWSADGNIEAVVAKILTPAEMNRARTLVKSGQLDAGIDSDVQLANRFAVNQTPTTIITHRGQTIPVVGVLPYSAMKQFLDELLSR